MITQVRWDTRKARKPHNCDMCAARIEVGEEHYVSTNAYDGRIYDWRECLPCHRDLICSEVYAWTGGYYDEGVGYEQAHEWAHENRDHPQVGAAARRWLERDECDCEDCVPSSGTHDTPNPKEQAC